MENSCPQGGLLFHLLCCWDFLQDSELQGWPQQCGEVLPCVSVALPTGMPGTCMFTSVG